MLITSIIISATQTYQAYGKVRSYSGSYPTRYQFTGQYVDDSALNYMNSRYYDRSVGMFISPDTIVPNPDATVSYNRYAYANLNPVNFSDPSGHCSRFV